MYNITTNMLTLMNRVILIHHVFYVVWNDTEASSANARSKFPQVIPGGSGVHVPNL